MTPTQRSPAPRGARQGGRQLGGCRRRDLVQSSPPCLAAHARDFEPITQHNERFTVELTHELYEEWEITAAREHQRRQCVAGLPSASPSTTGATAEPAARGARLRQLFPARRAVQWGRCPTPAWHPYRTLSSPRSITEIRVRRGRPRPAVTTRMLLIPGSRERRRRRGTQTIRTRPAAA
jgi:hypothetical protein